MNIYLPWGLCIFLLFAFLQTSTDPANSLTREEKKDLALTLRYILDRFEQVGNEEKELKKLANELGYMSSEFAYGHSNIFDQNQSFETNIESFQKKVKDFQERLDLHKEISKIPLGKSLQKLLHHN
jgi:hypothetical protein